MSTDAIVYLKGQHKEVRRMFKEFQAASDGAKAKKSKLAEQIIGALTMHTYLENQIMYPEVRKALPDLEDDVLESYEEHHVADVLTFELSTMDPDDEHFDAKMTVLMENVLHHVEEEEQEWFPKVREGMSRTQLQDMGARMMELEPKAPRKPTQPKAMKNALDAMTA